MENLKTRNDADPPMEKQEEKALTTGYRHPAYTNALAEFETLRSLPRSGGWILERAIPNAGARDGMGCYPLFACRDWAELRRDLDDLVSSLVSITVVTDPFGIADQPRLCDCFLALVVPCKQHF